MHFQFSGLFLTLRYVLEFLSLAFLNVSFYVQLKLSTLVSYYTMPGTKGISKRHNIQAIIKLVDPILFLNRKIEEATILTFLCHSLTLLKSRSVPQGHSLSCHSCGTLDINQPACTFAEDGDAKECGASSSGCYIALYGEQDKT